MARKGENIYKRKDGRWEARYEKGRNSKGQIIYGSLYGKSYREVREKKINSIVKLPVTKTISPSESVNICDVSTRWLESIRHTVKESTYSCYLTLIQKHILTYFNNSSMITSEHIQQFINYKITNDLSPTSVRNIVVLLERILRYGEDENLLPITKRSFTFPKSSFYINDTLDASQCNIEEIERLAHKYDLKVLYDAAHTFGETYKGQGIGRFGDVSCFSFHATKVFNTIEGGAVCYKDLELGRKLYELKNFGIHGPEEVDAVGANAKMNEFCAAMGMCNLRHIDEEIEKRKKVVERYRDRLENTEGLQLNVVQSEVESNYAYFPVVFNEKIFGSSRNEVFDALDNNGIGARKYFYPLTNTFGCFHKKYNVDETPVARYVAKRVLTLPLYADLAIEDVDRICDIILSCRQ